MRDLSSSLEVERIIAEVIPVIVQRNWNAPDMANIRTELRVSYVENFMRGFILEQKMFLLGKKEISFVNVTYTKVPKTWIDHFKETYKAKLPKWFLERFPIAYADVPNKTMKTTYRVCPHLKVGVDTVEQKKVHFYFIDGKELQRD